MEEDTKMGGVTDRETMPPATAPEPPTSRTQKTTHFADGMDLNTSSGSSDSLEKKNKPLSSRKRWTLGILADKQTDEVPGTVLLLSKYSTRNIPLGLQHEHNRGRSSTRGSIPGESERRRSLSEKKTTSDGQIILDPQPDDSKNDPLNWPAWRRDAALLSLGFYCMLGGGMTPILAAGFNQVAATLSVSYAQVARTTGLYMMGLGVGSIFFSPTAILFGKRPVYILSSLLFIASSIWCAAAPNYAHLATARVFQGIAISPVECLPSATIAEIFFLHERAFRIGIYTLLLLGGKNLVPVVSAAVIQSLGWRWVFWIIAIVVGFGGILLFLFVPETFWDRTPRPRGLSRRSTSALRRPSTSRTRNRTFQTAKENLTGDSSRHATRPKHSESTAAERGHDVFHKDEEQVNDANFDGSGKEMPMDLSLSGPLPSAHPTGAEPPHSVRFAKDDPNLPKPHNLNLPFHPDLEKNEDHPEVPSGQSSAEKPQRRQSIDATLADAEKPGLSAPPSDHSPTTGPEISRPTLTSRNSGHSGLSYTPRLRTESVKPWISTLKPWNGRLNKKASWWRTAIRPGILFAYPAVLWSSVVYALSIGWLIVLSESVSHIFAGRENYNFSSLQIGLVYLSPFIGGVLGTAVAGRLSDIIVRFIANHNDGIYEPEYRLVMAVPIAISTVIGLMGFGWAAEEHDAWIVPTIFFGVISFGCSLGSTTSITFCVDSYRQFAGEALVTLNFSKNVLHGLVWSLFFPQWLEADGSKKVFIAIGGIQLACLSMTIPMYIFGKRARMWTVRKGMMDRF